MKKSYLLTLACTCKRVIMLNPEVADYRRKCLDRLPMQVVCIHCGPQLVTEINGPGEYPSFIQGH